MIKRVIAASGVAATALVLSLGAGVAQADTQPANLGNVANANRGASAEGPHCHFVLPAGGNAAFDSIIAGTAHQAHVQTGLPTGVVRHSITPGTPSRCRRSFALPHRPTPTWIRSATNPRSSN